MLSHEVWVYLLAGALSSIAVGRITRLVVFDDFPPSVALRSWWARVTKDGPWNKLTTCGFCFAVWATPLSWAWAWVSNLHWTWWAAHGLASCMYLAAIIVAYDQPE